jgi:acyl-[acyl-carrier-protein]-phospholipid O-acyltransferase/long-chain-fatty-acid--[acyl-carrier-protein] ligase
VNAVGQQHLTHLNAALLVGNHTSCLDWAIIKLTSKKNLICVLEYRSTLSWVLSSLLKWLKVYVVHDWKSRASQHMIRTFLKQRHHVVLLIGDKIGEHAHLGLIDSTVQALAKSNRTPIIPFYLHGLWRGVNGLSFNYTKKHRSIRTQFVGIVYGKPVDYSVSAEQLNEKIISQAIHAWKIYSTSLQSIQVQWLKRVKASNKFFCVTDTLTWKKISPQTLFALSAIFRKKIISHLHAQTRIGVLLPPSAGSVIAILSVFCAGKTLVSLNYTLGESFISNVIRKSNVNVIISSRAFIGALKKRRLHIRQLLSSCHIIFIDDILKAVSSLSIFFHSALVKLFPCFVLKRFFIKTVSIDSIAAILFSSGSEGEPKGIELTHRNILGNAKQMFSAMNREHNEVMLSILPLFHAFGLTVTIILPLLEGIPIVCCADSTNVAQIGQAIHRYQATLLCGIPSLFGLYVRYKNLKPTWLKSLRLVIAGAEKLSPKIRRTFKQKFGLEVYEGYGATEVSPVASCNLPNFLYQDKLYVLNKPGTVGLPLPGSTFRVIDIQKNVSLPYNHFGLILIAGLQIMRGYLNDSAKTNQVLTVYDDVVWYKSGDRGKLDGDHFLTIVDRYSRMIKIAGEAISLSAVEANVEYILFNKTIEVIAIGMPDSRRGECIALLHSNQLNSEQIQHQLLQSTMAPLMQPSYYVSICEIPKLGNGKKDYIKAKKIVVNQLKNQKQKNC